MRGTPARPSVYWIFIMLLAAYGIGTTLWGEVSDILGGYGSDGIFYGDYTADFNRFLVSGRLNTEIYTRMLPLFIIHNALMLLYGEIKPEMLHIARFDFRYSELVVSGFKAYNLVLYLLSILAVHKLAKLQRMPPYSAIVFFIIVFVSFSQMKQWFFEPVMIDPSTMFHALLLVYFGLSKNLPALALTTIAGFAVNELNAYAGIILCCTTSVRIAGETASGLPRGLSFAAAFTTAALAIYLFYDPMCKDSNENKTIASVFPLSLAALAVFVFFAYQGLLTGMDLRRTARNILREANWILFVLLAALLAGYRVFSLFYADNQIPRPICDDVDQTPITYLLNSIRLGSSRPAGFLVAHLVYFGSGTILIGMYYRKVLAWVRNSGGGFFLVAAAVLILLVNSESRHLIFLFLLLATGLCSVHTFSRRQAAVILVINLLLSKAWVPLNPLGTDIYLEAILNNYDLLFQTPLQKYMMHLGPWMNDRNYIIWLTIGMACCGLLYAVMNSRLFAAPAHVSSSP